MSQTDPWLPMPRFLLRKSAVKNMLKGISLAQAQVLEMGFGAGEMLRYFHQLGGQVTGVDFSEAAFAMAQTRLTLYGEIKDIKLSQDLSGLAKQQFDWLFAFEVLEHIEDDQAAMSEWLALLKPGGQMIISVPAHQSKWNASDVWAGHFRRYEKSDIEALFGPHPVTIKKLWNYGFPLSLLLDRMLGKSKQPEVKTYDANTDKAALSKKSGTERKTSLLYRMISNQVMLFPFLQCQRLFYRRDIGSGYLVHVVKNA